MDMQSLSSRKLILIGVTILLIIASIVVINRKNKDALTNSMIQEEETLVGALDQPNARISDIQRTLQVLGYTMDNSDGLMNEQTRLAIKAFQTDKGFKVSGFVDSVTLLELDQQKIAIEAQNAANAQIAASDSADVLGLSGETTPTEEQYAIIGDATNFKMDTDEEIKAVQDALQKSGLYAGAIDGKLGPKSKQAIRDFQSANNLKVDGVVGPKTWQALQQQIASTSTTSTY